MLNAAAGSTVARAFAIALFLISSCAAAQDASEQERQELAPNGQLRVGLLQNNPMGFLHPSGSLAARGIGHDLGAELARRLKVSFNPVEYSSIGALLEAGKAGKWDVAFMGYSAARAKEWDYAPVHVEVEFGFMVPAQPTITKITELDRAGVRVSVQAKSQPAQFLAGMLKLATIVEAPSNSDAAELMAARKVDAMFGIKPVLFNLLGKVPGSSVLDGRPGTDPHAMALPKGRVAGLTFARKFIADAKSNGMVAQAIERAGLRGVVVSQAN